MAAAAVALMFTPLQPQIHQKRELSFSNMIKVSGLFLAQIASPAYLLANHHGQGCGRC